MCTDPPPRDRASDDELLRRARDETGVTEEASSAPLETETVEERVTAPAIPKRIGQYHIKRAIASGGMGTVYEAVQEKPRRTVAVKLMRAGIASRSALRRFEYESQLLARLRHPGIAQVYDAGTHRDAEFTVPYFAMEYIVGAKPVTVYAKEKKLGTRERIKLFINVCDAVHHGHQKGIIHRDLKPGNILVDSHGQVKIIDFGVARSTDSDLAVTTLQTDVGQLIGTLQYMSPEQCAADPHDIDTRSDVYALGVVFYELLCERLPYEIKGAAIHEATRVIREQEPTRLSTQNKTLRGDVETIALKALEKDRDRRYRSASELADDLNRYLNNEAISARPPSVTYQLRVFARRNKGFFASVAAVFAVLVAGVIVSTAQYVKADAARKEAELARTEAMQRATELEQVAKFQEEQLTGIDVPLMAVRLRRGVVDKARTVADRGGQEEADARAAQLENLLAGVDFTGLALNLLDENIFERTVDTINEQFETQPLIRARLLQAMADTVRGLGLYKRAAAPQEMALELRRNLLGDEDPETLASIASMGTLLWEQGDFDRAGLFAHEAYEGRRRVLGEDHPDTLESISNIGTLLWSQERLAEAEPYARKAVEGRCRVLGDEHRDTLMSISNLGTLLWAQGRLAEAEPYVREALRGQRRILGDEHTDTLRSFGNLGTLLWALGRAAEAEPYAREALQGQRRVLGNDHQETLTSTNNMGTLLNELGRYGDAAEVLQAGELAARRAWTGDNARWLGNYLAKLGEARVGKGEFPTAEKTLLEAYTLLSAGFGEDHARTTKTIERTIKLYESWDAAEPGKGYDAKAAEWRAKLPVEPHPEETKND